MKEVRRDAGPRWPKELSELDSAHGAKAKYEAGMFSLPLWLIRVMAAATITASARFEKTQNVADGKRPVEYSLVMTFSWT